MASQTITGKIFQLKNAAGTENRFPRTVMEAVYGLNTYLQNQFANLADIYMPINGVTLSGTTLNVRGTSINLATVTDLSGYYTKTEADGRYLRLTGGDVSGHVRLGNSYGIWGLDTNGDAYQIGAVSGDDKIRIGASQLPTIICSLVSVKHDTATGSYTMWDSGNDGAGSGLDADLLDGHDSSYFQTAADSSAIEQALTEGISSVTSRVASLEDWLNNPELDELTVRQLNVINDINGNADTATTLKTSRTIWGQSFNGSANITGALSSVTNINSLIYLSGNYVGIGAVDPTYTLHVGGTQHTSGAATFGGTISVMGRSSLRGGLYIGLDTSYPGYHLNANDQHGLKIYGLDDASSGRHMLYKQGVLSTTDGITSDGYITAGAAASSSDRRLKDNLTPVYSDRALSVLMQLKPMEWDWNENNAYLYGKRGAGLVAQDVLDVLPFAVIGEGEYLSLNYNPLHAYEIAGLQNHEERLAELERENRELKEKLEVYASK